jgi:hypothetical protein
VNASTSYAAAPRFNLDIAFPLNAAVVAEAIVKRPDWGHAAAWGGDDTLIMEGLESLPPVRVAGTEAGGAPWARFTQVCGLEEFKVRMAVV